MNVLEATLLRAIGDLREIGASFALIGGLAVSLRAEPRTTRDVDLAVGVADDSEAEGVVNALRSRGYAVAIVMEHESTGLLSTVRLLSPVPGHIFLDLLFGSSGIEPDLTARATVLEVLPGVEAPVATAGDLVALKLLARSAERLQDSLDLQALRPMLTDADVRTARDAVRRIVERGFHRDRDLPALLEAYLGAG